MKIILIFIIGIILINFISASDLELSLKLHCFKEGKEIIPTSDVECSSISFEIIGKNLNEKSRILNLTIVDSYPLQFKNKLPKNIKQDLRILQEKTLWISQIIDINQFNQTNIDFWVGIEGTLEKTGEILYKEAHLNLIIHNPKKNPGLLEKIGNTIWEDNYVVGLLVIVGIIFLICFIYWKYKFSDKVDRWRDISEKKRIQGRYGEEGY